MVRALDDFKLGHPDAEKGTIIDTNLTFDRGDSCWDSSSCWSCWLCLLAVRDASDDASEQQGSTLARLVELTVRAGLDIEDSLRELSERTAAEYDRILVENAGTTLSDLAASITTQLHSFAPEGRAYRWPAINIPSA